jgi:anti-sigma factor RsiW
MSENDMEEKILAYLLGECSGEEAFEVEKLCREDPSWQVEKIRLGQVIGLVEESLTDGIDASLPENECRLSTKQKEEIKALFDKPIVQGKTLRRKRRKLWPKQVKPRTPNSFIGLL